MIFWHATIPRFADEIIETGKILPSSNLPNGYAGWAFRPQNQEYGSGVYLAVDADWAIYYANIRLRTERDDREYTDEIDLYDEDIAYIALFRVHVTDRSKIVPVNPEYGITDPSVAHEFMYIGEILSTPGFGAWFDLPRWVSRSRDTEQWRDRMIDQQNTDAVVTAPTDFGY